MIRRALRRLKPLLKVLLLLLVVGGAILVIDGWVPFGKAPQDDRLARMKRSKQYKDGGFENPLPLWNDVWGSIKAMNEVSAYASPQSPMPVVKVDRARFDRAPDSGLRVTWLGHSTVLLEIEGHRILTDPVWGERTSPFSFLGPQRWYEPLISLDELPKIDAVLISHDHYDHLDQPTIEALKDLPAPFIAPLGVGAHLAYWGVPAERIREMDWWETTKVGRLTIAATPARHASGRQLFDQNRTLWSSYAILGANRRVFFSGDTGLFPQMADIGARYGPFDLTMIEVGAYHRAWPDWHIGPEQAIVAHRMLRGRVFLPVHWGLFNLAMHGWTEPVERVRVAAQKAGALVLFPKPGESVEPTKTSTASTFEPWWPEVPWETAQQHPIKSRGF